MTTHRRTLFAYLFILYVHFLVVGMQLLVQKSNMATNKRQHTAPAALDSQQVARLCGGC
jgi:hypothetical protein